MKLVKYRVVRDRYLGYEVQKWRLWFPFWIQMSSDGAITNTHSSLERAIEFINNRGTVWQSDKNK